MAAVMAEAVLQGSQHIVNIASWYLDVASIDVLNDERRCTSITYDFESQCVMLSPFHWTAVI